MCKILNFVPENISFHSCLGKMIDDQQVKPIAFQFWWPEFNPWESSRKEEADFQELFTDLGISCATQSNTSDTNLQQKQ